jgi:hypothetical protein
MTRLSALAVLGVLVGCAHHAPPPTTAAAPSAPAVYQDTAAAWAGLHPRPDTAPHPATPSQSAVVAPSTPDSASTANANTWMAANLAIGEGVFIVRSHYGGRVYVGAGNATQTMTLQVDADAIDDFIAETRAFLPPKKPRRDAPPPVLEEPKSGRTMSFGRHVYGGEARYRFFFSDDRAGGFSLPATLTETRAILAGLARGAAMARQAQPSQSQVSHP